MMAEHLLQRFATMGSTTTVTPPSTMATLSQRVHHEPFVRYPVYGPGSGPDAYEDGGDFWHGESAAGFLTGPPPPIPPPPVPPRPPVFPYRLPYGKFGNVRFKGASVAVLTLIGFLFFLSVLQNYIRDYSTTSTPTVIVLSAGSSTKENLPQYQFLQKDDHHSSKEDEGYTNYKKISHGKRTKNQKRHSSGFVSTESPPYSDLLSVSGLKKK
ncbi:uncharacterized protein LOC129763078 [Toxorhynchites rutilus septentrionalis]|uniref:uncharacterized protein LOC129763078 n=1 Tax=Toxorhynchites rutilus septentrionalis TaxID=329112 RepID=UPI002478E494|nr:uncharacterized protein LOC129763078 [Toxorhynchites rutilus septentrionalis]